MTGTPPRRIAFGRGCRACRPSLPAGPADPQPRARGHRSTALHALPGPPRRRAAARSTAGWRRSWPRAGSWRSRRARVHGAVRRGLHPPPALPGRATARAPSTQGPLQRGTRRAAGQRRRALAASRTRVRAAGLAARAPVPPARRPGPRPRRHLRARRRRRRGCCCCMLRGRAEPAGPGRGTGERAEASGRAKERVRGPRGRRRRQLKASPAGARAHRTPRRGRRGSSVGAAALIPFSLLRELAGAGFALAPPLRAGVGCRPKARPFSRAPGRAPSALGGQAQQIPPASLCLCRAATFPGASVRAHGPGRRPTGPGLLRGANGDLKLGACSPAP